MSYRVLIDLGKLKNPYSGLGQVSLSYGRTLSAIPVNDLEWTFMLPAPYKNRFGNKVRYVTLSFFRRHFPWLYSSYDVWHAIHHDSAYMPAGKGKTRYILTIHDLNFLEEKSTAKAQKRLKKMQKKVDRASAVAFISEYTKSVAAAHLTIPANTPVRVIYNGVEPPGKACTTRPVFLPEGEFLFTIGIISPKKNFHVLLDMMAKLPGLNLVIAGDKSGPYANNIEQAIHDKQLQGRVFLPGKISAEEKDFMYRHCKALVFPSLLEGFGLPVIEVMHYGKPVFASNRASLTEIGKDNAFYWNNFLPGEMAEVVKKGLAIAEQDTGFSDKLKKYAHQFSWEESARQYIDLYRSVVSK